MSLNNKFVRNPAGSGQVIGGGPESYEITGNMAFFRDDFNATTIDTDEWMTLISGSAATGASAGIYLSAGNLCLDMQAATGGQLRVISKRTFALPFRLTTYVGFTSTGAAGGLATGSECIIQLRDTAGVVATSFPNPTYAARIRVYGAAAGGATVTGGAEIRANGTAAGFIASAGIDPTGNAGVSTCGIRTGYVIDADYSGVSFAVVGTAGTSSISATGGNTNLPPPPTIVFHAVSPILKTNQKYHVEFVYSVGTSCVEASNATATASSGIMRVYAVDVRQYSPVANFQRPGPLLTFNLSSTAGAFGASAMTAPNNYLKWS